MPEHCSSLYLTTITCKQAGLTWDRCICLHFHVVFCCYSIIVVELTLHAVRSGWIVKKKKKPKRYISLHISAGAAIKVFFTVFCCCCYHHKVAAFGENPVLELTKLHQPIRGDVSGAAAGSELLLDQCDLWKNGHVPNDFSLGFKCFKSFDVRFNQSKVNRTEPQRRDFSSGHK